MVFDSTKERLDAQGRDKAIEWYLEIRRLEAELAGQRARLLALQTTTAVAEQVRRLPAVGASTDAVGDQLEQLRRDAQHDLDDVAKRLDRARKRWEVAKKAKDKVEHLQGQENRMSDLIAAVDTWAGRAGELLDRVAASAGTTASAAVTDVGDATSESWDAVNQADDQLDGAQD